MVEYLSVPVAATVRRSTIPRFYGYEIEQRLATGGMAEVYIAKRQGPHGFRKRVALKRILPQFAQDETFVRLFIEEARLAARLEHPNIVQVFDFGEEDDGLYLAMELVDGTNVNRLLRAVYVRNEVVPVDIALHIAAHTARALAYAHQACDENGLFLNVVHRDVSPANILLTRNGHIKLSDFGIAHIAIADRLTEEGRVRGKLGYMSPEQVMGKRLDARSDIFTLATVLAEMLIAEPLFGEGSDLDILLRIRNADLRVLDTTKHPLPSEVRRLLAMALDKVPDKRPSAALFAEGLDAVLRKRGAPPNGADDLANLLHSLELLPEKKDERPRTESGVRPTWLIRLEKQEGVASSIKNAEPNREPMYKVSLEHGEVVGPMDYASLVRMFVTGAINATTKISKQGSEFVPAEALSELLRFVYSPALQWSPQDTANATAQGDVNFENLVKLVNQIGTHRQTGMVHLEDGKRRKKIYFVDGNPDFIASTMEEEMLGQYLISSGLCLKAEVDQALNLLPRYGGHLGDALVGLGVLRPMQLYKAVAAQVRSKYLETFRWKNGRWHFVLGAKSNEETLPLGLNAHTLLTDAVHSADSLEIEAALRPVAERVLSPNRQARVNLQTYRLPATWEHILCNVHEDTTLSGLVASEAIARQVDPEDVYKAVFLGLACELLQVT